MILTGKIRVFDRDRTPIVAAILPQDVSDYYLWFAQRKAGVVLFRPKTPFHLTVISARWDSEVYVKAARAFRGRKIKIELLLETMRINKIRRTGAIGLYCDIRSKDALDFRRKCGIIKPKRGFGGHVTFGTTKSKMIPYEPKMVTIRKTNGNLIIA